MKMFRILATLAALFAITPPAAAQWQTPNHSVPIGRGIGNTGFGKAAPGTAGLPFVSNGASSDPSFQALALGTGLAYSGSTIVNTVPPSFAGTSGLVIVNDATTPNTSIDMTADQVGMVLPGNSVYFTGVSLVVSTTTTGANGLDTGSRAANTWYHLFFISNGSTIAGIASLSPTAPAFPAGYTFALRAGAMRTDGSGNFLRTRQAGNRAQYTLVTGSNTTAYPSIFSVAASNITVWTAFSVSTLVPPTATRLNGSFFAQGNTSLVAGLSVNGVGALSNGVAAVYFTNASASAVSFTGPFDLELESSNIFGGSTGTVTAQAAYVYGWTDK